MRIAPLSKKGIDFLSLARTAAQIADDKKGEAISLLNVRRLSSFTDYFVVVTADSRPQINAISEQIKKTILEDYHVTPVHRDGTYSSSWAVIDYGGVVIHIMSSHARQLYRLEMLWRSARHISF